MRDSLCRGQVYAPLPEASIRRRKTKPTEKHYWATRTSAAGGQASGLIVSDGGLAAADSARLSPGAAELC